MVPGWLERSSSGLGLPAGWRSSVGCPSSASATSTGTSTRPSSKPPTSELPMLALIVSGGHTELALVRGRRTVRGPRPDTRRRRRRGFDKVARLLGLAYPGGPEVERAAADVSAEEALNAVPLPPIRVDGLDFSFSGIKTAVRYALGKRAGVPQGAGLDDAARAALPPDLVAAACAAFQSRAVAHSPSGWRRPRPPPQPRTVAIAGGVAVTAPCDGPSRAGRRAGATAPGRATGRPLHGQRRHDRGGRVPPPCPRQGAGAFHGVDPAAPGSGVRSGMARRDRPCLKRGWARCRISTPSD